MDTIPKKRFIALVVWLISLIISLSLYTVITNTGGLVRVNAPLDIYICAFYLQAPSSFEQTQLGQREREIREVGKPAPSPAFLPESTEERRPEWQGV